MTLRQTHFPILSVVIAMLISCSPAKQEPAVTEAVPAFDQKLLQKYIPVTLTADIGSMTAAEREILSLLIDVGKITDKMYWYETYGQKDSLLQSIQDEGARKYAE